MLLFSNEWVIFLLWFGGSYQLFTSDLNTYTQISSNFFFLFNSGHCLLDSRLLKYVVRKPELVLKSCFGVFVQRFPAIVNLYRVKYVAFGGFFIYT